MGMAFNGFGKTPNPSSAGPLPAIDALPAIRPTTWQKGGKGWNTVGGIGDVLAALGGREPVFTNANMDLERQQQMLQRQIALAQYKAQHPDPTSLQRNYEYLQGAHPDLAEQYLRAEANPMTLMTDPATGAVTFQPKGGPAPQAPVSKTLPNGQTAYWVNGAWYDNPEGR